MPIIDGEWVPPSRLEEFLQSKKKGANMATPEVPITDPNHPDYVHPDIRVLLYPHGGSCCGMNTIKNFWIAPHKKLAARAAYPNSFPIQSARDRLAAVIRNRESSRSKGILEIVLVDAELEYGWGKILVEEFDFVEVNSNINSNSGNTIHVFHRNSGGILVRRIPENLIVKPRGEK